MSEPRTITTGDIEVLPIEEITPYWRNPRTITAEQVEAVAVSIERYGYQQPIVVDRDHVVVVGHTRLQALRRLGYTQVPVHVSDLPADKAREYRIVDNKTSEMTSWDHNALVLELREFEQDLLDRFFPDVDLEIETIRSTGTTDKEIEAGTKKALAVTEAPPFVGVTVECPSCFHRFTVKASAMPGITGGDVAGMAARE